jgi:hypothetical protein
MTRTRTVTAIAGAAALALTMSLAACGGVDREGTRDELIEQFDQMGVEADADCIDDALDAYSDDELEALDEALSEGNSTADAEALLASIMECAQLP